MNNQPTPDSLPGASLDLATREDLIDEMRKRSKAFVFSACWNDNITGDDDLVCNRWHGGLHAALGLAELVREEMRESYRNILREEDHDD